MSKPEFVYTIYIEAPAAKVWHALTHGEHTQVFWKRFVRADWKVGGRVEFLTEKDGPVSHDGEVLEIDPPTRLVMTFDLAKAGINEPPSRVTYELSEHNGPEATKFTVIHEGFPPNSEALKGISSGWPRILSGMKTYLERGGVS